MMSQGVPEKPGRSRLPCAAIFDWDGTLADTRAALLATWRQVTRDVLGRIYPANDEEVMTVLSRRGSDVFATLSGGAEQVQRLQVCFDSHYVRHAARQVRVFPGAAAALSELRRHGIGVGVVTSKTRSRYDADSGDLASLIDVAVCAEDVASAKPDPEGVHRALAAIGASPGHAVLIGDTAVDIATGAAARVPAVGVTWGSGSAPALNEAGAIKGVDGLESLVETVVNLLGLTEAEPQEGW